ncbi:MAG: hypothetical protein AB1513_08920 [Pseudomonadota bacterium]
MITLQVEGWQLLIGVCGGVVVIITAAWALARVVVGQFRELLDTRFNAQEELRKQREKTLDERFSALEKTIRQEGEGWRLVERDLLELKADLPIQYMRREDAIRQEVVIHAKLDALAAKIDALRGGNYAG